MRREQVEIEAPSIGGAGTVIGYGHYGRPVLLFQMMGKLDDKFC